MSTSHLCAKHPKGKRWQPGPASACKHHDLKPRENLTWRVSKPKPGEGSVR